jgi:hypothetical protein
VLRFLRFLDKCSSLAQLEQVFFFLQCVVEGVESVAFEILHDYDNVIIIFDLQWFVVVSMHCSQAYVSR